MHVAVTGATGNVGTALVQALLDDPAVTRITGIARRAPAMRPERVAWVAADVTEADLAPAFDGADAVVHLAWAIQPSHDRERLRRVNVDGSARVFDAAVRAGVPALVYASSVGAYSEGPKDAPVDESWPTGGTPSSFYAVDKAAVEGILDEVEEANPSLRVVRLRPGLIFSRRATSSEWTAWKRSRGRSGTSGIRSGRTSARGNSAPRNRRATPDAARREKISPGRSRTTRSDGLASSTSSRTPSTAALSTA